MVGRGVVRQWKSQCAGSYLRRGGRSGGHNTRCGLCGTHVRTGAIGAIAGVVCFLMVTEGQAQVLDMTIRWTPLAFTAPVGCWRALLTGVFAVRAINPIFKDAQGTPTAGWFDRRQSSPGAQSAGGCGHRCGTLAVVGTLCNSNVSWIGWSDCGSEKIRKSRAWICLSTAKKVTIWKSEFSPQPVIVDHYGQPCFCLKR